jgi:DUF4097 and DUF4098 domain-containing protein YvlB
MRNSVSTIMKLTSILLLLTSCVALAATEEQIKTNFNAASGGSLVVDVDFGSIDVTTGATDEVSVDVWRKVTRKDQADEEQFLRENPVQFLHEGDTVTVRCRHKQEKNRWFNWGSRGNQNEGKVTIRVPARFNASLDTSGGAIAVSDLTGKVNADTSGGGLKFTRLHGPLKGDTSGGSIRVADCEGEIKIDTSGGGIELTGGGGSLKGESSGGGVKVKDFRGSVSVESSGGGITIENVGGKLRAETSGGPINAVLPSPIPDEVSLESSGGGVTVRVPQDAAFNLDAEASGGGVSCDLPITIQGKKKHDELKGAVNGGGPTVKLESSGGGIHVKKL